MATFEPGHLHVERHALNEHDYSYNLHIDYEVSQDPKEGKGMLFKLHGSVQGKDLKEEFFLPKDQAFDFARHAMNIAQKYGMPKMAVLNGSMHKQYDLMFEDVRHQLDVKSGDPVKPEHLQ
ncbi:DUF5064 family protein [Pseudomonas fluorescens]|uniref:Uncharacterized protein n=1 Tax=Pseudomonas orientalis TaxID=76758 RepID=A0A0R2ZW69_9PSED|nr:MULTISPECIES: DUF5064 family protein [Pseudomonas fluorescens group]KRP64890.1 acetyl-CoA carboxylase [Pseudomonas orientalis]MBA1430708.1 DUF5064 family protein [Pseudomonas orientalis]MBD8147574.1 DUF5064 family protein [Pseudomonas fluorescens]MBD8177108.1 DUF5064 family protein [Pseudomonas fluorescens]MBD8746749.1 DUF5064 family protein [Pseudomonas fluorescens]